MAPRRGARVVKVEQAIDYDNLTVKEVLCPICRSILIEPVTLPCHHVFCSSCFQGTMENANLACPLCRVRIGSWLRTCKKDNKLINLDYWNAIKKLFPEQIKNKLDGIEENLDYEDPLIQLAKPGELKKEYETQMRKETESFKREREAEIKASEALIQKLNEEEEYQKIIEEEKLRLDEEIARKLAEELNTVKNQKSSENPCSQLKSSNNNNNSKKSGPLDRFLQNESIKNQSIPPKPEREKKINYATKDYTCRILCHDIENEYESMGKSRDEDIHPLTLSMLNQKMSLELQHVLDLANHSDSSDSIESECRYFKPIDYRRSLPCQKTIPIRVPAVRAEVKTNNLSAPKGQNTLRNDPLTSAFAAFGKLSLEEKDQTSSKSIKRMTKVGSLSTEKNQLRSPERNKKNGSPGKKKKNNFIQSVESKKPSTQQKVNQNKNETQSKANILVKRKLSDNSPDNVSPSKKSKPDSSFARFLDSPSSPFKGFGKMELEVKLPQKRVTRNNKIEVVNPENIDSDKVKLQVKSDYELAKKLQEHFNSSSYSTRSSAPRRGKKVARQATLDSMLSKQSKFKH